MSVVPELAVVAIGRVCTEKRADPDSPSPVSQNVGRVSFLSVDELYGLLCDGVVMNPDEGFLDGEDGGWDGGPADFFVAGGPPRGDREGEPSQDENDRFADA